MTIDAAKQQAFAGPIVLGDVPTFWTSLRGVLRIHFHDHAPGKCGFRGQHRMQFGKAPFGEDCVRFALFARNRFAAFPVFLASSFPTASAFSDAGKVFNTDEGVRMLLDDRCADLMVGLLLEFGREGLFHAAILAKQVFHGNK